MALFNKVGDLYQKAGKVPEAADTWERALTRYAEGGFANNAIALCNKILRVAPARTHLYLKLAQLMVQRGLVSEAKQHFLEYANRMQKAGKLNEAFRALKEFADLSPENSEIRLMLAEQLKSAARTDEAREQLAKLYADAQASGDARKSRATLTQIQAIDPDYDVKADPKAKPSFKSQKSSDLVFLDLGDNAQAAPPPRPAAPRPAPPPPPAATRASVAHPAPPPPKRPSAAQPAPPKRSSAAVPPPPAPPAADESSSTGPIKRPSSALERPAEAAPPPANPFQARAASKAPPPKKTEPPRPDPEPVVEDLGIERSSVEFDSSLVESSAGEGLSGMDIELPEPAGDHASSIERGGDVDVPVDGLGLDVPGLDLGGITQDSGADLGLGDTSLEVDIDALDIPAAPVEVRTVADLEADVADDPDDPARHKALGEALLEAGDRERGLQELDLAMSAWETREEWQDAQNMADEIIRLDSNSIRHHQKRVEYAFRLGDRPNLVNAYLELADAFFRSGAMDRARTVYQRVLEHDADNQRATSALQTLEPEAPPAPADAAPVRGKAAAPAPAATGGADFVDLGSLLDDEPEFKDTRMRIQDEEPTGDEERDFQDMLAQFKKGIEQTVGAEDAQTHYDLGVAFKEMGLLDEAIAEFQKALPGENMRTRASEALGLCFFEKGQPSVAATVLRRAIEQDPGADDQKIGLLYWLARSEEEQGNPAQALPLYQRVFALNIAFQDVKDRVKTLAKAAR